MANLPTAAPCLVYGKVVCRWGTGATDVSWRDSFGDMMLGETGMQNAALLQAGSWW